MGRFAAKTKVPSRRTRDEIEELLAKHKATSVAVYTSPDETAICFEMNDRRVLFRLRLPDRTQDQEIRRRWRALFLAIKSKLVSVQENIESFEDAFLAHIVMPDGQTVADHVRPRIATAYTEGKMQPLLPGPTP